MYPWCQDCVTNLARGGKGKYRMFCDWCAKMRHADDLEQRGCGDELDKFLAGYIKWSGIDGDGE